MHATRGPLLRTAGITIAFEEINFSLTVQLIHACLQSYALISSGRMLFADLGDSTNFDVINTTTSNVFDTEMLMVTTGNTLIVDDFNTSLS